MSFLLLSFKQMNAIIGVGDDRCEQDRGIKGSN